VGIYVLSSLLSKKHRTPCDWAAGASVVVQKQERGETQLRLEGTDKHGLETERAV
jgi:hypothetical protein